MKVLVTGANGFLGRRLAAQLVDRGDEVVVLVRPSADLSRLPTDRLTVAHGRFTEGPEEVEKALAGVEVVYHVAGATSAWDLAGYLEINAEGTRHVMEAAARAGVRRVVLVSSLAAAGPAEKGRPITEADPCRPVSDYGKSKLAGEEEALKYKDRLEVVIVRPPAIYGPGDEEFLPLFKAARRHLRPLTGRGDNEANLIHADDEARGIVLAGTVPEAAGEVFFVGGENLTLEEIGRAAARTLGTWAVPLRVPGPVLYAAGWLAEKTACRREKPPVFSTQKVREMSQPCWTLDDSKARRLLGYAPRFGLAEGFADTVAWYKAEGLL